MFDHTDIAIIVAAAVAAIPAVLGTIGIRRTHKEVKTNHGIRAGERIERLTDDVLWLKENVATKTELKRHADDDQAFQARVEPFLVGRN